MNAYDLAYSVSYTVWYIVHMHACMQRRKFIIHPCGIQASPHVCVCITYMSMHDGHPCIKL